MSAPVLVVEDDAAVREALAQTLELAEFRPIPAGSFVAAKDHIARDFAGDGPWPWRRCSPSA